MCGTSHATSSGVSTVGRISEIVAWSLQAQTPMLGLPLGLRLAHACVSLDVAISNRHRYRIGIVLHRLIQLPTTREYLGCSRRWHYWDYRSHIQG